MVRILSETDRNAITSNPKMITNVIGTMKRNRARATSVYW